MNEPEIIENPDIIIPRLDTISWDDLSIPEDETYNRVLQYLDDLPSEPEETVDVDEVPVCNRFVIRCEYITNMFFSLSFVLYL